MSQLTYNGLVSDAETLLDRSPAQERHPFPGRGELPEYVHTRQTITNIYTHGTVVVVTRLPQRLFDLLENAANSHKPVRSVDPHWGVDIWH